MKKATLLSFIFGTQFLFSQVGINTSSPNATLDVVAKATNGSSPEGILTPRLTGNQIQSADNQYTTAQRGILIYATAPVTSASPKTVNITSEGYYYFDGNIWQKVLNQNTNLYNSNGILTANRTVTMEDKILSFTSTATTGTSHFQVDGNTLNVDAVNNRIGLGTNTPSTKLHIDNGTTPGAIRIVDGTQGEGKILVSDANGLGTWRESSGAATVITSNAGPVTSLLPAGTMIYTGANATVTVPGYYMISTRLITDKTPSGCGGFLAINFSQSPTAALNNAFPVQDVHVTGSASFDFIYTSNIAFLQAGTYYMRVRTAAGCTSNNTRGDLSQNSFTLTLLK
ncbi:hypothetical protein [Chryseobacterium oranimense]|uniref:hypothetical protein n=1 Tax=Chryseobacterium oranimense TaxID=421058 RepID=UPI0022359AE4|nr:hypothetical protein [Chryseobacterium oranimense]